MCASCAASPVLNHTWTLDRSRALRSSAAISPKVPAKASTTVGLNSSMASSTSVPRWLESSLMSVRRRRQYSRAATIALCAPGTATRVRSMSVPVE